METSASEDKQSQPFSLFETCVGLVARNLDLVESFSGFPALIGEKIFKAGRKTERFMHDVHYMTAALRLFADAFEDELLSSLSVIGRHLGFNYSLEQLLVFEHLRELDVSRCGLGDDHEILAHIQQLRSLKVMCMSENMISNFGVQKMTAPYRMFEKGPAGLQCVDVSRNAAVDVSCLKYLTMFQKLDLVILSETESKTYGNWAAAPEGSLINLPEVQTQGWAAGLVHSWMVQAEEKASNRKMKTKKTIFYSRHKVLETLKPPVGADDGGRQVFFYTRRPKHLENSANVSRTSKPSNQCNTRQDLDIRPAELLNIYWNSEQKLTTVQEGSGNLLNRLEDDENSDAQNHPTGVHCNMETVLAENQGKKCTNHVKGQILFKSCRSSQFKDGGFPHRTGDARCLVNCKEHTKSLKLCKIDSVLPAVDLLKTAGFTNITTGKSLHNESKFTLNKSHKSNVCVSNHRDTELNSLRQKKKVKLVKRTKRVLDNSQDTYCQTVPKVRKLNNDGAVKHSALCEALDEYF